MPHARSAVPTFLPVYSNRLTACLSHQAPLLQNMAGAPAAAAGQDPQVAVITTLGCPYCKKSKAALQVCAGGCQYVMEC